MLTDEACPVFGSSVSDHALWPILPNAPAYLPGPKGSLGGADDRPRRLFSWQMCKSYPRVMLSEISVRSVASMAWFSDLRATSSGALIRHQNIAEL